MNEIERLIAELDAVPKDLHRSLRPNLPPLQPEPRGWRDVLRCLLGRHRITLSGRHDGALIERCSCGGIRFDGRPWFETHPFRITDAEGYTRSERRELRRIEAAVDRIVRRQFEEE